MSSSEELYKNEMSCWCHHQNKTQRKEFMNQTIYEDVSHDPFSSFYVDINQKTVNNPACQCFHHISYRNICYYVQTSIIH